MDKAPPYTLNLQPRLIYPACSLLNLLRMGHCAPTVMQTVLQLTRGEQEWLVKLTAGLPGGIGNTQGECGGVTSPLIVLGLPTYPSLYDKFLLVVSMVFNGVTIWYAWNWV